MNRSTEAFNKFIDAEKEKFYVPLKGVFFSALCLVLPFFLWRVPMSDPRSAQELLLCVAAMVSVALFGVKNTDLSLSVPLGILMGLSFWTTWNPFAASYYHQVWAVAAGCLVLLQAHNFRKEDWAILEKALAVLALLQIYWLLGEKLLGDAPYQFLWGIDRVDMSGAKMLGKRLTVGVLGNPSLSPALLIATVPFIISSLKVRRSILFGSLATCLLTLFWCNSSMAWLGLAAAGYWWFWRWAWNQQKFKCHPLVVVFFALVPVVVLLGYGITHQKVTSFWYSSHRFDIWSIWANWEWKNVTWSSFHFGRGLGWEWDALPTVVQMASGMDEKAFQTKYSTWDHIHNEFMAIYMAWGLAGFVILGFLAKRIKEWGDTPWFYCFLALWVNAAANFTFHLAPTVLLMLLSYSRITQRE